MMNYLRRRFSDPNAMTGLPDGYFQNLGREEVVEKRTAISTSNSPTMPRRDNSMGFLSSMAPRQEKGNQKTLLVIDDPHTDWAKYFRGKLIHGEYEIRVEQCEFSELNLASYSDAGVTVDMRGIRQGQRVVRTFKPDFVLVRQHARSMEVQEDWRNLVIGFKYGNVPSVNSWQVVYNFMDKPWVFAQLSAGQEKHGKEKFPLIDQAFFPNHREMEGWKVLWSFWRSVLASSINKEAFGCQKLDQLMLRLPELMINLVSLIIEETASVNDIQYDSEGYEKMDAGEGRDMEEIIRRIGRRVR